jgi:hypothetical protein
MVGMLQIITYLLCVYLVFKGVEIFQLALTSARADGSRAIGFVVGAVMIGASIIAAAVFSFWITDQAVGIQGNLPGIPR